MCKKTLNYIQKTIKIFKQKILSKLKIKMNKKFILKILKNAIILFDIVCTNLYNVFSFSKLKVYFYESY